MELLIREFFLLFLTAGSTRFHVEEVPESSKGNGHSIKLDEIKTSGRDEGMSQEELRSRTNSIVDPSIIDVSQPIKGLKAPREIKLKILVFILFILIIISTTCILLFYSEPPLHYKIGRLTFYVDSRTVRVSYRGSNYTHGKVGLNIPYVTPSTCAATTDKRLCLEWQEFGQLEIDWLELDNMDCYDFVWTHIHKDITYKDCFSLQNTHWYGGAIVPDQKWPFAPSEMSSQPYLSGDDDSPFGPVAERYWLSSNGLGLQVNDSSYIFVSMNPDSQEICLESGDTLYSFPSNVSDIMTLEYTVCLASDLTSVHRNMSDRFVKRTKESPDSYVIANPTWSLATPLDKSLWNDSLILNTATELKNLGYDSGVIEIPTSYAANEGDLSFDGERFLDVRSTMTSVKALLFKTSVQVTPYCSTESTTFLDGVVNGYWVNDPRNLVPGLTKWGNQVGSILDVTSDSAVQSFKNKLQSLQALGVDQFSFDYGQASYLPVGFQTEEIMENPDEYATKYVTITNDFDSPFVRSVYQCQHIPVIVKLIAKDASWDYENGLKTIIPTALTMGLQGYPYFMPDLQMNPTGCSQPSECYPDKELFIRYIELSAFMPAMQIPTILSEYDDETRSIVKQWVDFHASIIAPLVLGLAGDFTQRGDPIIRPLWWTAPTDQTALRIDSEFMVGDDLLVAPVLSPSTTVTSELEVYLPQGSWQDTRGNVLTGGLLVTVDVPLGEVAYFRRSQ